MIGLPTKVFIFTALASLAVNSSLLNEIRLSLHKKLTTEVLKIIEDVYAPYNSKINFMSGENVDGLPSALESTVLEATYKFMNVTILLETPVTIGSPGRRICNIFFVETFQAFVEIFLKLSPELFEYQGFYTIILTNGRFRETDKIFELFWRKQIYKVVIFYCSDKSVKALTFSSFNSKSCFNVMPYEVTNFTNLFRHNMNLKGCPISVHTPHWAPFTFIENNVSKGRDVDLMKAIARVLNFKLDLKILTDPGAWGIIFDNGKSSVQYSKTLVDIFIGTATHAMKSLLEHKADIIIGDYYLRPARLKFMDASVEYFNTDVVFIIPPGRHLRSIEKLLQPFSRVVWNTFLIFLLFTIASTFVIIRYLKLGRQSFVVFFDIFSILFAVSTPRLPKVPAARILMISFVIFCLVKQAAYVGALFKILQTDSSLKEVQSIDEMLDKGYQFYVYDLMYESIHNEGKILER